MSAARPHLRMLSLGLLCSLLCACEQPLTIGRVCSGSACASAPGAGAGACDAGACGSTVAQCTPRVTLARTPLDLSMLVDTSGSLLVAWEPTRAALQQFFSDPAGAGTGLGLTFFGESCDPESYATPAVPIAALPENASALSAAIPAWPLEDTPTRPALEGALRHARRWALTHPERKVCVLLVTDGLPDECDSTTQNVTELAHAGFLGDPSIQTLVVGIDSIGGLIEALSGLAAASGAQAVTVAPGEASELLSALTEARERAAACRFSLPALAALPSNASSWLVHTGASGVQTALPLLPSPDACADDVAGFYILTQGAHRHAEICPQHCGQLGSGQVELLTVCERSQASVASSRARAQGAGG